MGWQGRCEDVVGGDVNDRLRKGGRDGDGGGLVFALHNAKRNGKRRERRLKEDVEGLGHPASEAARDVRETWTG